MKLKHFFLAGLCIIPQFSVEVLPVTSFPKPPIIASKPKGREQEIFRSLNLSPAQVTRMRAIRQKYKTRMDRQSQSINQAHQKLKNLMVGNSSASQIRSQHNRVQSLKNQLDDLRLESLLEMRGLLTPSQRQKLAQMMERKSAVRPFP